MFIHMSISPSIRANTRAAITASNSLQREGWEWQITGQKLNYSTFYFQITKQLEMKKKKKTTD